MVLSLGWATVNEKPFVIPELKEWNGAEGMFSPSGKCVVKGGKSAEEVAQLFASDYQDLVGKTLIFSKSILKAKIQYSGVKSYTLVPMNILMPKRK